RLKEEGDLVRVGTAPVTVESGAALEPSEQLTAIKDKLGSNVLAVSGYYLQTGGIVSYYTDGYEAELTPDTIQNYDYSYFSAITQDSVVSLDSGSCLTDYPIFKIIADGEWRLVAFVPNEHADRYVVGNTVRVIFDPSDDTNMAMSEAGAIEMDVISVETGSENTKLVLGSDMYFDNLGKYRVADVRIISDSVHGLLLSSDSITEKDGKRGVYLKDKKGKYYFIQVQEIGTDGNITAVTPSQFYDEDGNLVRTLDPYDDVLKDPSDA
ncbi:MAG: HlyD family efflux transporter periplasmic adaptor subunit, partial [Eubacterium sp.]